MKHRTNTEKIILLAALAIALFMMLPRIAIVAYSKGNPDSRINEVSWWDPAIKFLYSFLIAWIFLWLNVHRFNILNRLKILHTHRFSHRLLINIVLLIMIRLLFKLLGIPEAREVMPAKASAFLFNISLIIEVSFCIFAAEIYVLLIRNQEEKLNNEKLLKANAEANFEVLKNQVNPHFLFNSLNTINAMIDNDTKAAKRFVANMSHVYRYVLNSTGKQVITLAEEMDFTTAYINMLLERHSGSLLIETDIPGHFYTFLLPPVSAQVLIENAVKHNIVSVHHPLAITIKAENDRLIVANRINGKKQIPGATGTGLYNLNQRYLHLCDMEIDITKKDGIFSVSIPLLRISEGDKYIMNANTGYNESADHRR